MSTITRRFRNTRYKALLALCNYLSPFTTEQNVGEVDWPMIVALANRYYLVPGLRVALASKGLWEMLEPELAGYLDTVYKLNMERNRILLEQINGNRSHPLLW